MKKRLRGPDRETATGIAASALAFLAEDRVRLVRFLDLSGLAPAELALRAADPVLLAAVLDHLLEDEAALLMFTAHADLSPDDIAPAAAVLRDEDPHSP